MQIIYAFPFFIIASIACVIYLANPRLRPHALCAFAAPLGFGACSIIGMALLMVMIDKQYESLPRFVKIAAPISAYVSAGLVGAWIAVKGARIVTYLYKHFFNKAQPQ